jgi:hypothetical protein
MRYFLDRRFCDNGSTEVFLVLLGVRMGIFLPEYSLSIVFSIKEIDIITDNFSAIHKILS